MKILIDLTSLADNFSGIERYAACISYEMILESQDEYILLFKGSVHPIFEEFLNNKRVELVVLSACKKLLFNQIRLPKVIYKFKADWYLFLAFPVPVLLFKKNMVSTIHDICSWDCPETMNGLSNWYFKISHKLAMRKCKRIITISKFSEDRIVERLKYQREKIWLIYCGVDEKFLSNERDEKKDKRIREKYNLPDEYLLSLSTLEPRKNLRLLIDAYSELVIQDSIEMPLVLAGRKGWKTDKLLSGIDEIVKKNILFAGFIDDADLPTIYGSAALFVFPSLYEGFGMPPLEAMACGAKVLSSDASSLPEVLGDSAIYFKSESAVDLKEKLLYFEKMKYKNISLDNNRDYMSFSWKIEGQRLLSKLVDGE